MIILIVLTASELIQKILLFNKDIIYRHCFFFVKKKKKSSFTMPSKEIMCVKVPIIVPSELR